MSKIKMIALDIDGTIMDGNFNISEKVKKTVKKAIDAGIYVVLATGRMYSATVPIAKDLGIITPLITYQGGMIKEFFHSDETLLHYTISTDLSKEIIGELRNYNAHINVYLNDELFIEDESHILVEYAQKRHVIYHKIEDFQKVIGLNPTKILCIGENASYTTEIKDSLKSKYAQNLYITKSTPLYCEIVNNCASKGKAILFLAEKWGISPSDIMVIGDQDNDREMLQVAGLPVAMGNGTSGLKEIAKYITDTVDNDGAALAIEKFAF